MARTFRIRLSALVVLALTLCVAVPAGADEPPPPTTTEPVPLPEGVIADGVSIGGVPVGGLTPSQAKDAVNQAYMADVPLAVGARTFRVTARRLGFHVYTATPLRAAYAVGRTPGTVAGDLPLVTRVAGTGLRTYVKYLATTFDKSPVDARLVLRGGRPRLVADVWGRKVDRAAAPAALLAALRNPARPVTALRTTVVKPTRTKRKIGMAIVINRSTHRLTLYQGDHVVRTFGVATGQPSYPTPAGAFSIVTMQRSPWWYPPSSTWAAGASPIPPGPGNPLGTRWMGLSVAAVGIHGTPDPASIGYSASHGCIRMAIPDAEWVFAHVTVGTPVWIL